MVWYIETLYNVVAELLKDEEEWWYCLSFYQKYEAKKKASFPSPFVAPAILEEQIEEQKGGPDQDRVI